MARSRLWLVILLFLVLACAIAQYAWSQFSQPNTPEPNPSQTTPPAGAICKVYSLADFTGDPTLGKWIADTIPEVIQPGSWKITIRYNPNAVVMVVSHTPAVHAQVEEFLKNLRKARFDRPPEPPFALLALAGLKQHAAPTSVVEEPKVSLRIDGPAGKRYVGRPAEWKIVVRNDGDTDVSGVVMRARLPEEQRFVRAEHGAAYP
jgi:hypothetical protein